MGLSTPLLHELISWGERELNHHHIENPHRDILWMASDLFDCRMSDLHFNKKPISGFQVKTFKKWIQRRVNREPVQKITGKTEFYGLPIHLGSGVFIPRPETELLIYKVTNFFKNKRINVLDIGTGSGCILLSILKRLNLSRGTGIDISPKAIQIAKVNSKNLNLHYRSKFKVCNLSEYNIGKYDLIVSNPPYIPSKDIKNLSKDILNYEPLVALKGGVDGLDLIKKVIYKSSDLLKRNGLLSIEIGRHQYQKVSNILRKYGFKEMSKEYDYKRNIRCIISTKVRFF